jgi:hypothetical protein
MNTLVLLIFEDSARTLLKAEMAKMWRCLGASSN